MTEDNRRWWKKRRKGNFVFLASTHHCRLLKLSSFILRIQRMQIKKKKNYLLAGKTHHDLVRTAAQMHVPHHNFLSQVAWSLKLALVLPASLFMKLCDDFNY